MRFGTCYAGPSTVEALLKHREIIIPIKGNPHNIGSGTH